MLYLTHTVHALGPRNARSLILPKLNKLYPNRQARARLTKIMWLVLVS
jgi:hypothetical protein